MNDLTEHDGAALEKALSDLTVAFRALRPWAKTAGVIAWWDVFNAVQLMQTQLTCDRIEAEVDRYDHLRQRVVAQGSRLRTVRRAE